MVELTTRKNNQGSLTAFHLGACRVGYAQRCSEDWIWNTLLVRPEGGCWMGRARSLEEATEQITEAVRQWVEAAGLQRSET